LYVWRRSNHCKNDLLPYFTWDVAGWSVTQATVAESLPIRLTVTCRIAGGPAAVVKVKLADAPTWPVELEDSAEK
jgi:hypothetical protein